MICPNCGDEITGVALQVTTSGVIYKEDFGEPKADLCSYPELEADMVDAGTIAECMDCEHKAELREFFPGDINADLVTLTIEGRKALEHSGRPLNLDAYEYVLRGAKLAQDSLRDEFRKKDNLMLDELRLLYQEVLLDHGKNPRNHRTIDTTYLAHGNNPMCGDTLVVFLDIDNELIKDISFKGVGCAISVASASIMTQLLKGKTIKEAEFLFNIFHKMCTEDDFVVEENDDTARLQLLAGVRVFPMRVKCATLAWHTMDAAVNNHKDEITTE